MMALQKPRGTLHRAGHRENTMQRDTGNGWPSTLQGADSPSFPPQSDHGLLASRSLGRRPSNPTRGWVLRPSKCTGLSCLWLSPWITQIHTDVHVRVQFAGLSSNTLRPEANRRALWAPTHFSKFSGSLHVGSPSSSGLLGESAAQLAGCCPVWGSPPCSAGHHGHCPAWALLCACPRAPTPSVRAAAGLGVGASRCHHGLRTVEDTCVAPPSSWGSSPVFLI